MKKLTLTLLLGAAALIGAESQIDIRVDTDPSNLQGRSSFHVATTTVLQTDGEEHALLFCPEMGFHPSGAIDFSLSGAHRHKLGDLLVGHSVFFDRTNIDSMNVDQIGTGFDVLTDFVDFRANYYHPVTYPSSKMTACKWADSEVFFKTPYFGVGTGPLYNFSMKEWALHSRVAIPCKGFTINLGALCGEAGFAQAVCSVSFHLFKPKGASELISHPSHIQKSNIYYVSTQLLDKEEKAASHYLDDAQKSLAIRAP